MILIDETKLTNGTLMSILSELGYKTDYYRCWTEEEKETILAKELNDEDRKHVKRILDNEKHIIDFETMFKEQLDNIRFYEDDLWQLVDKTEQLVKEGKEEDELVDALCNTVESLLKEAYQFKLEY